MSKNICFIDGLEGILKYREIDINQLDKLTYDSVSYLLIQGNSQELKNLPFTQPACMGNVKSTEKLLTLSACIILILTP